MKLFEKFWNFLKSHFWWTMGALFLIMAIPPILRLFL